MEILNDLIALLSSFIDIMLHLDVHLNALATSMGGWTYVIVFLVVFCETGLIVLPFLPGDSLLFALGALTATEGAYLSLPLLAVLLITAGILGDAVNYAVGRWFGPRIFSREDSFWFHKDHLVKTQKFYDKYGGKTIVLARFMPIIRTFAPFVAGIGNMQYRRFAIFNVTGAVSWVMIFLVAGNYFGNIPAVKRNFHIVIIAIILISVMPMAIEVLRAQLEKKKAALL